MAFSATNSTKEPRSWGIGPVQFQVMTFTCAHGDTSGTITADKLKRLDHVIVDHGVLHSSAPSYSGNVATLAIVVPSETAASKVVQDITYTAVAGLGASGNSITIAYTGGATAGAEVVSVVGNAISIQIETGVSTATQVKAAFDASVAAVALASAAITGTAGTAQVVATATAFTGGVNGGARGTILCIGN